MSVAVNPPKTPVTKGSNGIATATIPNICKMPGPPAPFVPTPLPNIGKSDKSPKGYSKKVKIEGNPVAIKGASFNSIGDIASKGTGGGLVSSNTEGPTKFVGPGSLDVKIEGKNVQLLSDPMLNNCGPSGTPPNAATLMGILQKPGMIVVPGEEKCPVCEKAGHGDFKEDKKTTKPKAKELAKAFKARLGTNDHATMLAVAICDCGTAKYYADKSGSVYFDEFKTAAGGSGCKHRNEVSRRPKKQITKLLGEAKKDLIDDAWDNMDDAIKQSKTGGPTAYAIGNCAGPRALLLLLDDGGIAAALTERWFDTTRKYTGKKMTYIDNREGKMELKSKKFAPGETVPPCATCEVILPLLLCKEGKKCH
jgi:hypothetical protein